MTPSMRARRSRTIRMVAAVALLLLLAAGVRGSGQPAVAASTTGALALPDLAVTRLDRTAEIGDWQALLLGGELAVTVANRGDAPTGGPTYVTAFEDADGDGRLDPVADTVLGGAAVPALAEGESMVVTVSLAGPVLFRDNLLYAMVDPAASIPEVDEENNVRHTGQECAYRPSVGSFEPRMEWEWTGSRVAAASRQVMMTPAVIDLDADGIPDVVFTTYTGLDYERNGHLRAVRGSDGAELFTVTNPRYNVNGSGSVAVGDIDGDRKPEIVAVRETGDALLAFENDGTFKWRSPVIGGGWHGTDFVTDVGWGGPSLADLDGDGAPEVIVGNTVLNGDGTLRWAGPENGGRGDNAMGPLSLVADIDLDSRPEIVAGNTVYRGDGETMWVANVPDGFPAVANFDADPFPEIALVSSGNVYLLDHDGRRIWGPTALPGGSQRGLGGPPTIGDMDGDRRPEIGVAGGRGYMVVDTNGRILWTKTTQDLSSSVTGSTVFDFEGDGLAEVLYGDELRLRVYRGTDGLTLWDVDRPDGTTYDMPLVADVDADGNAEIVAVSNNLITPGQVGLRVYGDPNDTWLPTRQIWNQHSYHVGNVNDDGTIPSVEAPSWQSHNTYRLNRLPEGNPFAAPDVTASRLDFDPVGLPGAATLIARIGSGGAVVAPAGLPVSFYAGQPSGTGRLIGTGALSRSLEPGQWMDVRVPWSSPPVGVADIWVVADDDGTAAGTVNECDEGNNAHHRAFDVAFVPTATATITSTPTPTATATSRPTDTSAPTASPTRTPTSAPTPTPRPRRVYLPRLTKEPAVPRERHADVVIVVDASASMAGAKVAEARSAAEAFVTAMRFPEDQAAVIESTETARLVAWLTPDVGLVREALRSIAATPGTRLDRGLALAVEELAGPRQRSENVRAILLLSDGQQYEEPEDARAVAAAARADGIVVYTIGLGDSVDEAMMVDLAGGRERYRFSPTGDEMAAVYWAITATAP